MLKGHAKPAASAVGSIYASALKLGFHMGEMLNMPARRSFPIVFAAAMLAGFLYVHSSEAAETVEELIRRAGSAEQEALRLDILKTLQQQPGIGAPLKSDVDKMVAFVERWIGEKSLWRWWDREIRQALDYDFGIGEQSPLYPLTCLYRGRMLVWATNEYGNIIFYHDTRRKFFDKAVEQFKIARAAFPDNRIIGMYLGEPIGPEKQYPNMGGAPAWAALQREGLERLADIIDWWIDHRLQEDGQYGGAWDDDCEMWRHWVPVMVAFESPKVSRAQAFFSEALLRQEYMKDGYTSRTYDVEHTAEPSTDTITPMMHLSPDDAGWKRRAMRLAELMETVWTGRNERGMLQFKSTYFNALKVDPSPKRACDTPYHVVAIQPTLVLWQRTGDEKLTRLFSAWMDTWVDASARSERGKPAGVIPAAIYWPEGRIGGPGPDWWDPQHHGEPKLYEWPSAVTKLTDALLLTWHMTGKEKYLAPIRSMARIRSEWLTRPSKGSLKPGSEPWCGSRLGSLGGTLAKYRLLTGSTEFDELLARDYGALTLAGPDSDRKPLTTALRGTAGALRVNFPGYTSEVRFTDRVLTFPRLFGADMMFPEAVAANSKRPDPNLLYATATGNRGGFVVFPLGAVRWLTPPRQIAALVTRAATDGFTAELFHFGHEARRMGAEFYLLSPGRYTYELQYADLEKRSILSKPFSVDGPRTRIEFTLPPKRLIELRVVLRETR